MPSSAESEAGPPFRTMNLDTAVQLCHALVVSVGERLRVRTLFIKGPAAQLQGIRLPKLSADTDVLVREDGLSTLISALAEHGWVIRPEDPDKKYLQPHSVTMYSPNWPCDIDLHFRFPGIEADWDEAFDFLWARRETVELAHQRLSVPRSGDHLAILLLNELRNVDTSSEFPHLRQRALERADDVLDFVGGTGSAAPLRPVLELMPQSAGLIYPRPSTNWRWHTRTTSDSARRIIAIVYSPWREKPALIWHSIFAPVEVVRITDLYADGSPRSLVVKNVQRWSRALHNLVATAREVVRYFSSRPPQY
ncbi:nucleotidyltransferase family protein [Rathayibacter toxicus]|nr:nucleotidyltransferase family protein [Rathayibacter toxicus]ALS57900.1 hypothetical protein APU90_09100 [Rathayibacter toxicus]QOD08935.1 nucleotidyltransferase family protein [Rathayibacter toxicus]QOD11057.1 nucleotidyltransferase family protein [Rathayibacter toxicus]